MERTLFQFGTNKQSMYINFCSRLLRNRSNIITWRKIIIWRLSLAPLALKNLYDLKPTYQMFRYFRYSGTFGMSICLSVTLSKFLLWPVGLWPTRPIRICLIMLIMLIKMLMLIMLISCLKQTGYLTGYSIVKWKWYTKVCQNLLLY